MFSATALPFKAFTLRIFSRNLSSLRRPGPSSSLRRRPPPKRVVFRDEIEARRNNAGRVAEEPRIDNTLLAPVYIPEDPNGVLNSDHPATRLLDNSGLVVQRQLELGNLLLGFEQANKYVIMDPNGNHVGFMAEQEAGIGRIIARQWFSAHRAFTTHVFDKDEKVVLRFHRPFAWINSRIRVFDPVTPTSHPSGMRIIGECQQEWHLLRRKYNLFLHHDPVTSSYTSGPGQQVGGNPEQEGSVFTQFAYVDEPFLSWDFSLLGPNNELIGSVNRNFAGFGRELFTETGVYALRMDAASAAAEYPPLISNTAQIHEPHGKETKTGVVEITTRARGMTLDERAVMLATAVTIDFDYFSRRYGHGIGFFPFFGMGPGPEYTDHAGQAGPMAEQKVEEDEFPFGSQSGQGGFGHGTRSGNGDNWPWEN